MVKTRLHAFLLAFISIVLAATIVLGWQTPSYPVEFNPPDRGAPENLIGAGTRFSDGPGTTRGPLEPRQAIVEIDGTILECPFSALVPQSGLGNYGLTLNAYPTFFIHFPQIPRTTLEFVLSDDDSGEIVYQTSYVLAERDATFGITLPRDSNVPPLEVGKIYTWQVSIRSNQLPTPSGYIVRGEIERFEPTPKFAQALVEASPEEKVALYAEASLWYDAVKTLADLRRTDPDNDRLRADWIELMQAVGLDDIAAKPLL
ncbi:MAG: DUF928 domain-containing protein [Cyanobacteriota bacterium]|nr:DUF928 domain-containing protein [Cyanobacteriota bacterium]